MPSPRDTRLSSGVPEVVGVSGRRAKARSSRHVWEEAGVRSTGTDLLKNLEATPVIRTQRGRPKRKRAVVYYHTPYLHFL